jgi:hypothetical protein
MHMTASTVMVSVASVSAAKAKKAAVVTDEAGQQCSVGQ